MRERMVLCVKYIITQNKVNPVSVYVPELITRETHEQVIGAYKEKLEQFRQARLSAGNHVDDHDDEDEDETEREELPF